jgi:hypothetical protein
MPKSSIPAAGGAMPLATSRRALLAVLAAASPIIIGAAPTPALAEGDDSELLALDAEIGRMDAIIDDITAKRIEPFEDEYCDIMGEEPWEQSAASIQAAEKLGVACGRDDAIAETEELYVAADRLFKRMREIPARTQAGRAAKVRALIRHVLGDEWRGADEELNWGEGSARSILGEFAGMSAEELAAI